MKKGFVIIVTYNGIKWIDECLNSVLNSSIKAIPIVIDNNSTDTTVNYIEDNFKDIIIFKQEKNLGFGRANNIGISYALRHNADFVFLLNQDAFVEKNTIQKLIDTACIYKEYGILSPIQLEYSGKKLESYFYNFMAEDITRSFYSDYVLKRKLNDVYNVNFIQAAAWFLPLNTIREIGGFDPIFYHYGEDNNYCQRLIFHKLKIGVVPNSFVRHDSTKPSKIKNKGNIEKQLNIYRKNICKKYANINEPFNYNNIRSERIRVFIRLGKNLLKFDFFKVKIYFKQLIVFKYYIKKIKKSRKTNMQKGPNYLEVN